MALTKASLSGKIKTEIEALYGPADDNALLVKFCDAIAKAVVDEIKQNGQVEVKAGDLTVAPGSFSNGAGAVTGVGAVNPAILPITRIL